MTHTGDNRFTVELKTDGIAAFVWLEARDIKGHFSDNGFMMVTPTVQVDLFAWQDIKDAVTLQKTLLVTSLSDVYRS